MSAPSPHATGLVVLAADVTMQRVLDALLHERTESLAQACVRAPECTLLRHRWKDPGAVSRQLPELLRSLIAPTRRAIVVFDHEGCGRQRLAAELEREVEDLLSTNGWRARACAVCIEPEVDTWVWGNRRVLAQVLGTDAARIAEAAAQAGMEEDALTGKPLRPKEALQAVTQALGVPGGLAWVCEEVARKASFRHCHDRAFQKLLGFLRLHFPI